MSHYYSQTPDCAENEKTYRARLGERDFVFYTNAGVFSKNGLDFGTRLLIESIYADQSNLSGNLLDMGCGYGPISIALGLQYPNLSITMADINERALQMAQKNAQANGLKNTCEFMQTDGFSHVDKHYQTVVTNPPIRAGKETVFSLYEGAYERLEIGGCLYVVIQKKQGAPSTQKKLIELFGNCRVVAKKSGYFIFCAVKS